MDHKAGEVFGVTMAWLESMARKESLESRASRENRVHWEEMDPVGQGASMDLLDQQVLLALLGT